MSAEISVPQAKANEKLQQHLEAEKEYTFQEIKQILEREFGGVNSNQCSGIIHRAHSKTDGVLKKEDKYYKLRARAVTVRPGDGLDEVKRILQDALREIENIPVKHFKTGNQFEEYVKLKERISVLIE